MITNRNSTSPLGGEHTPTPSNSSDPSLLDTIIGEGGFFTRSLEVGSIFVILGGSLLLFVLLGGCSNRNADIDLGLKAKFDTTRISTNSPLEDKPIQPVAEETAGSTAKSAPK